MRTRFSEALHRAGSNSDLNHCAGLKYGLKYPSYNIDRCFLLVTFQVMKNLVAGLFGWCGGPLCIAFS